VKRRSNLIEKLLWGIASLPLAMTRDLRGIASLPRNDTLEAIYMNNFLAYSSAVMFLFTACIYLYYFLYNGRRTIGIARGFLVFSILLNIVYIISLSYTFRKFPLSSFSEAFDFIAVTLAISYLLIEITSRNANTGFLIMVLVFIFKLVSIIFIKHSPEIHPILTNGYFILHVIPSVLGYTAFSLSMIYGILYLLLYKELQKKSLGNFYKKLPPLEVMHKMTRISVKLGFALLTAGIFAGFLLSKATFDVYFKWDPKIVATLLIWIIYLAFIVLAAVFAWKGKRYSTISVFGFLFVILAFGLVEIFMKSFHSFT
jgi:ABC-type uncharacterized transport system permease subunit